MPTVLTAEEREKLILEYERGASVLRTAWESIPEDAEKWRPAPEKWSAHEVVIHCADSETYAATRIRLLIGEKDPLIVGYDQDAWAKTFDYHAQSTDRALRTIDAVRTGTLPLLRALSEADWAKEGRHTQSGPYNACDWLKSYGAHLTNHAKQIDRNLAAYRASAGRK
ncbi:MAG: DinB family protein [Vicinamibacteria bacterium]|nr:DinB family protein [Vicinamibacteria bacterium]